MLGLAVVATLIAALTALLIHRIKNNVSGSVRLAAWAERHGFTILSAERRWLLKGPFFGSAWEPVYRLLIRDHAGDQKAGWLCLEHFFNGSGIVTKWDDAKGPEVEWEETE